MLRRPNTWNMKARTVLGSIIVAIAAVPAIGVAAPAPSPGARIISIQLAGHGLTNAELGQLRGGAAVPYATWLNAAAVQAEGTAGQARAAATAYEAAYAATVHPPAVAANRAQLASLIATNILGLNAPAISSTEAQYAKMWAQDVAAMIGYQAGAAATAAGRP